MDPNSSSIDRRRFLKTASATGLGLVVASESSPLLFAGGGSPNEKVVVAVMGLNGRGTVLARAFARTPHAEVASVCDVDAQVLAKAGPAVAEVAARAPAQVADFRRALDDKAVDALVIAAPDHWHAPAAILAMQAGKHVYVEKPCGHNPHEGELLVRARSRYGRVVQMGTQQRSSPHSIEVIQAIKEGAIGRPYLARGWYANTRATIGRGAVAPVPPGLDYALWQGPAPRTPYRDNVIHYNWHWFRRWGTGEICNNGTHEIDICRWALGVDYPVAVTASGGRYHFADDWEFPDTQEALFEFADGRTIVWQGQSCNGLPTHRRSRGVSVLGTAGSVVLDRDGYTIYDLKNQVVRQFVAAEKAESQKADSQKADSLKADSQKPDSLSVAARNAAALNVTADDAATGLHIANFVEAVRTGAALHSPIEEGVKSVLLCHLGNIAQRTGRKLRTDATSGRIIGDADAMKMWSREYAPGWAPSV